MATTKQVSDLIVKLMRINSNHSMVADLTELQRHFRAVESDLKLQENKVQQFTIDAAKYKKEIDTLKKELESLRQATAARPSAPIASTQPGEPQRVVVGHEWKTK